MPEKTIESIYMPDGFSAYYWEDTRVWAVITKNPIMDSSNIVQIRPAGFITTVASEEDAVNFAEEILDIPNKSNALKKIMYAGLQSF